MKSSLCDQCGYLSSSKSVEHVEWHKIAHQNYLNVKAKFNLKIMGNDKANKLIEAGFEMVNSDFDKGIGMIIKGDYNLDLKYSIMKNTFNSFPKFEDYYKAQYSNHITNLPF